MMLGRAMPYLLKPLRKVVEGGLEVKVKAGEIRNCFAMIL